MERRAASRWIVAAAFAVLGTAPLAAGQTLRAPEDPLDGVAREGIRPALVGAFARPRQKPGPEFPSDELTMDAVRWMEENFPSSPRHCTDDFDGDRVACTDEDIEAFVACLGGACCASCASPDFDGDGVAGADSDIGSFLDVLAGSGR